MKTHPLTLEKNDQIIGRSLLGQVGSAHNNIGFIATATEMMETTTTPVTSLVHPLEEPTKTAFVRHPVDPRSIAISFHQINYQVGHQRRKSLVRRLQPCFPCCKVKGTRHILHNVTGGFGPGMNAILGPSGCGKSSLLDILADRKDKTGLSGRVLVRGKPRSKSYKYQIGYVVQDDIISGTLTVRENLMFSANVRLSRLKTMDERTGIVDRIIEELGLQRCADSRIGTHFIRGISGGEKRRACIGMELVLSPSILFLDEPTSGLDASTAENVMKCLHALSREGCTIIFSIHQPRYSIFKLFDNVLLLSSGHPIYLGRSTDVLSYFAHYGYQCEEHDNPADFSLDILIHCQLSGSTVLQTAYSQFTEDFDENRFDTNENLSLEEIDARSYADELYFVCLRTIRNTIRDPAMAASQIIVAILLALLTGLVFNQIQRTVEPGVQNRLGVIFFIVVNQIYSTTNALEPLVHERALFIHEYAGGYYRVSTFFIAKLLCDLFPMRLIPSLIYSSITYSMIGLQTSASRFFVFLLTVFVSTIFGAATCFFVASTIPIFVVSLIIVVFIFVVMMVFSGFLIDMKSVFSFLRWIQWLSAFRYATNLLTVNEFQGLTFCLINQTNNCPVTGEQVLSQRNIPYQTTWDIWQNLLALSLMAGGLLLMTYIQLVRMKKVK